MSWIRVKFFEAMIQFHSSFKENKVIQKLFERWDKEDLEISFEKIMIST